MARLNLSVLAACFILSALASALPTKRFDPMADEDDMTAASAAAVARDSLQSTVNFFDDMNEMWKVDHAEKIKDKAIGKMQASEKAKEEVEKEEEKVEEQLEEEEQAMASQPSPSPVASVQHSPVQHKPVQHRPSKPSSSQPNPSKPSQHHNAQTSHTQSEDIGDGKNKSTGADKNESGKQEPAPEKESTPENDEVPTRSGKSDKVATKPSATVSTPSPASSSSAAATPSSTHEVTNNFFSKIPVLGKLLSGGGLN
ncbi:hypothetical protein EYZ11_012297 [Aspergillus tanneri]|uniref:Uncharacterized protein n=1 Tax=Aspergillus tanneri TaxID=1220188 RepID=A0A4S3J5Z4_9EURO|nr:uncharacterized protein ATNIH1004_005087 [Aspergillus tanneri]KAA8649192.1 hypothetical protein ATNIH1004_005087 [Aspergillus tanneri]THC88251.1 hypothetical protein EYZ11_012297 [Aspergillus tanneri]